MGGVGGVGGDSMGRCRQHDLRHAYTQVCSTMPAGQAAPRHPRSHPRRTHVYGAVPPRLHGGLQRGCHQRQIALAGAAAKGEARGAGRLARLSHLHRQPAQACRVRCLRSVAAGGWREGGMEAAAGLHHPQAGPQRRTFGAPHELRGAPLRPAAAALADGAAVRALLQAGKAWVAELAPQRAQRACKRRTAGRVWVRGVGGCEG